MIYSPYLLHHRADLFPEPERFDPDRWLPDREQAIPRNAYIPFGGGARKCIGETYGLTEATLALASITTRWSLQLPPGRRVKSARPAATLSPRGLHLRASNRNTGCSDHSADTLTGKSGDSRD